ncbi:MAG TPA: lipopolysaccharide heptosyltransferase II [Gammaproteobacteria bacterium]|nr:lipopolysaccharide heptosyltransferase II [Gammaproteobacteria bacterium]
MQQILVIGPSWVGDMVMAQSLFMDLRQRYPQAAIDVVAPRWSLPLLARMPQIRQGFGLEAAHGELRLRERYRLGRELRARRYERAIVLTRSLKSALIPYWARIPQRTGYRGEWRFGLLNDMRPMPPQLDQTVKRFVALGLPRGEAWSERPLSQPSLRVDEENRRRMMQRLGLNLERPVVGIMPGAEYGPAKQWPPEYFAELLRSLAQRRVEAWIFGSQKDYPVAESIVRLSGGWGRNLCGQTRLEDAVDLISAVSVAVSNDSGLMHIAAALQRPLLALYGSSSPAFTPPLDERAVIFYRAVECSPCFLRKCPYGHYRCLREITVGDVLSAVNATLAG